jgi:hypothetical protein
MHIYMYRILVSWQHTLNLLAQSYLKRFMCSSAILTLHLNHTCDRWKTETPIENPLTPSSLPLPETDYVSSNFWSRPPPIQFFANVGLSTISDQCYKRFSKNYFSSFYFSSNTHICTYNFMYANNNTAKNNDLNPGRFEPMTFVSRSRRRCPLCHAAMGNLWTILYLLLELCI